ncbi:MAG: YegS/Rv2252/BmrU family lipid kinase [Ruminococcaceae bacterium]|nr:YegS/Rv2252/BmrU family lipid kinase [Oscillospiraceae bacterium]
MKTVFIVNPMAGQGKNIESLVEKIKTVIEKLKSDAQIYITESVGDATEFVRNYCKKHGAARFIACGGDGTLGEVVNGCIDCHGSEVGIIPMGTGNDFCRNFKTETEFSDIEAQFLGNTVKCDAVFYKSHISGTEKSGYCVNMFNIGFDCNVADMTARMKKKPCISGSLAYFLSIFAILIKKKGANLKIELDGKQEHEGPLLLTSIANGCFCGGGIKSNPLACVKDGLININIIFNISRFKFLTLLPYYMKGTHMKLKNIENIIHNKYCEKVVLTPLNGNMKICIDGEIEDAGKTEFKIVHDAFNFVVPEKVPVQKETVVC